MNYNYTRLLQSIIFIVTVCIPCSRSYLEQGNSYVRICHMQPWKAD